MFLEKYNKGLLSPREKHLLMVFAAAAAKELDRPYDNTLLGAIKLAEYCHQIHVDHQARVRRRILDAGRVTVRTRRGIEVFDH